MEFVQERVSTIHDYGQAQPLGPVEDTTIIIPLREEDTRSSTTTRILNQLSKLRASKIIVALNCPSDRFQEVLCRLDLVNIPIEILWCNSPRVKTILSEHGFANDGGKGRDLWLAIGVAAIHSSFIVCHDADQKSFSFGNLHRLLAPLERGYTFTKGYYARIEHRRMYARLFRLFVVPVLDALAKEFTHEILEYLRSFRYALAGEVGFTSEFARSMQVHRGYGLEIGMLGEAYAVAGSNNSAQVDLGVSHHDHRPVKGDCGLESMSTEIGHALLRVLKDFGIQPSIPTLKKRYLEAVLRYTRQYKLDAKVNGLSYNRESELNQASIYADQLGSSSTDNRLPPWNQITLTSRDIQAASQADIEAFQ